MTAFKEILEKFVAEELDNFISILGEKYSLDPKELKHLFLTRNQATKNVRKAATSKRTIDDKPATCQAKIQSGKRKGELCGRKAVEGEYCKQHFNIHVNGGKKKNKKSSLDDFEVCKRINTEEPILAGLIFENHYKHDDTGLVFSVDENDEKIVIGRVDDENRIIPLTKDDIEICKQWRFLYKLPPNITDNPLEHNEVLESDEDEDSEEEN